MAFCISTPTVPVVRSVPASSYVGRAFYQGMLPPLRSHACGANPEQSRSFFLSLTLSLSLSPNDTRTMTTLKTTVCQLCRWLADSSPTACQQLKKTVPQKRPSDTFVSTLVLGGWAGRCVGRMGLVSGRCVGCLGRVFVGCAWIKLLYFRWFYLPSQYPFQMKHTMT